MPDPCLGVPVNAWCPAPSGPSAVHTAALTLGGGVAIAAWALAARLRRRRQ